MSISLSSKPNIAFTGLKEDIAESHEIVRRVREGCPQSNMRIAAKIRQHSGQDAYVPLFERLSELESRYEAQNVKLRHSIKDFRNFYDLIEQLKKGIEKHKVGNCTELALLSQYEHLMRGIEVNNVFMSVEQDGKELSKLGHAFSVRELKKSTFKKPTCIEEPATWGSRAVIIDPFFGFVGQAVNSGLDAVHSFLGIDPKVHKISYFKVNQREAEMIIRRIRQNVRLVA